MASIRQRGSIYEVRVKKQGSLAKPAYGYFPSEEKARAFGARVESVLATGQMPEELKKPTFRDLKSLVQHYAHSVSLSKCDRELWKPLLPHIEGVPIAGFTYQWVERWVPVACFWLTCFSAACFSTM